MAFYGTQTESSVLNRRKWGLWLLSEIGLVLATCAGSTTSSRADGVCKADKMPVDYVAVAQFTSPQCPNGATNPFAMNAWEVAQATDGVTACELPAPAEIGATAASLVPCERTTSTACPARSDGLPNAVTLRTPAGCVNRGLPVHLRLECTMDRQWVGARRQDDPKDEYWPMVGQVKAARCPLLDAAKLKATLQIPADQFTTTSNAFVAKRHRTIGTEPSAICANQNNYQFYSDIVVKRFHNPNCPNPPLGIAGREFGLNAWIIVPIQSLAETKVVACLIRRETPGTRSVETQKSFSHAPREVTPGPTGEGDSRTRRTTAPLPSDRLRTARNMVPTASPPDALWKYAHGLEPPSLYAEQCGGPQGEPNAYQLTTRSQRHKGRFGGNDYISTHIDEIE